MISASAPGKLYIAGEYAVVEPGHRAVLVAVDRFITVRVTVAEHAGRITSDLYATLSLTWYRRLEDDVLEVEEQFDDYVVSAIRVVEQMVREKGGSMRFFDLDVSSELDDDSGRKLGLGSSSAVTVATVRAVAGFYGLPLDDMAVYKLALLASDAVQPIGSGGDIAASAFTGWVGYTSPDRAWTDDAAYTAFLRGSENCLGSVVQALLENDTAEISRRIEENRRLLSDLSRTSGITIETPQLRRLAEIAQEHGAVAKSSGAGGGDCGIALCPPETDTAAMCAAWEKAGIRPLDLSVHFHPEVAP